MHSDESLLSTYYLKSSVDFYNNWYSTIVKASTQRKRNKRKSFPFYFSCHFVQISNQIETQKRRLAQNGDETSIKLLTLQENISQYLEFDKNLLASTFNTLSSNHAFKLFKQLSGVLPIPPEVYLGNAMASDDNAKAELFNEFLLSVYQEEWFKFTTALNDRNCKFCLDEVSFSTNYIEELLLKAPESSSSAADIIPPLILKTSASIIAPLCLCFVYPNTYLSYMARFLEKCKWNATASKADIKNYRGISILPKISLVMEKIVYNFISEKICHKLSDCQNVFRSRRSTFTLILKIL